MHVVMSRPDAPFLAKSLAVPTGTTLVSALLKPRDEDHAVLADKVLPGTKSDMVDQVRRVACRERRSSGRLRALFPVLACVHV